MKALRRHLELRNPRFRCLDAEKKHSLTIKLRSMVGPPATARQLHTLKRLAGTEYTLLEPLYREFNGVVLHSHRDTAGLVVAPVNELASLAKSWKASLFVDENSLYPFQRGGVPFATIAASGNYFVAHKGKVYYSDHDGGDDAVWGTSLDAFFRRALRDPAKFLTDAGCYTRYFDGKTKRQFIPEAFIHD